MAVTSNHLSEDVKPLNLVCFSAFLKYPSPYVAAHYRRDVNYAAVWVVLEIPVRADGGEAACGSYTRSGATFRTRRISTLEADDKILEKVEVGVLRRGAL